MLQGITESRTNETYYSEQFSRCLHDAMGYRAEHLDELAF
jgi:hypothetical protein